MSKLEFNANDTPTIGIELELGLVDARTMNLSNSVRQMLDILPEDENNCFKPELMQSFLEINTCVCQRHWGSRDRFAAKDRHLGAGGRPAWIANLVGVDASVHALAGSRGHAG